jgi:hypothetical protein
VPWPCLLPIGKCFPTTFSNLVNPSVSVCLTVPIMGILKLSPPTIKSYAISNGFFCAILNQKCPRFAIYRLIEPHENEAAKTNQLFFKQDPRSQAYIKIVHKTHIAVLSKNGYSRIA